jgi:hypothetical protein
VEAPEVHCATAHGARRVGARSARSLEVPGFYAPCAERMTAGQLAGDASLTVADCTLGRSHFV